MLARIVDEYWTQESCGDGEEMGPIQPFDVRQIHQAEIRLMNMRYRLKRVLRTVSSHVMGRRHRSSS